MPMIDMTGHMSEASLARFGRDGYVARIHPDGTATVWHGYAVLTIRMEYPMPHLASNELYAHVAEAEAAGEAISDDAAATIASWWQSPAYADRAVTMISHGVPVTLSGDYADAADTMARNAEEAVGAPEDRAACHAFEQWARGKARQARDAAE